MFLSLPWFWMLYFIWALQEPSYLSPVPLTLLIVSRDIFLIAGGFYIRYKSLHPPVSLSTNFVCAWSFYSQAQPLKLVCYGTMVVHQTLLEVNLSEAVRIFWIARGKVPFHVLWGSVEWLCNLLSPGKIGDQMFSLPVKQIKCFSHIFCNDI